MQIRDLEPGTQFYLVDEAAIPAIYRSLYQFERMEGSVALIRLVYPNGTASQPHRYNAHELVEIVDA